MRRLQGETSQSLELLYGQILVIYTFTPAAQELHLKRWIEKMLFVALVKKYACLEEEVENLENLIGIQATKLFSLIEKDNRHVFKSPPNFFNWIYLFYIISKFSQKQL